VVGVLTDTLIRQRVVWTCTEIVDDSKDGDGEEDSEFKLGNDIDFGRYNYHHIDCNPTDTHPNNGLCTACAKARPLLLSRFNSNLKLHTSKFNRKRTEFYRNRLKQVSRRQSYKAKALAKLTEETGVDCPINEDSDKISDITMEENVRRFISSDPNDRLAAIAEYVFAEACQKHKLAKEHGTPLVIRLAAAVYDKMGNAGGRYDILARCFCFPTSLHLRNYTENTASEPDGILYRNLRAAEVCFDERNPNCPANDEKRSVILKLDEMHIRGRFGVDFHTNRVVGMTEDALDKSILEREFNELISLQKEDGEDVEEVSVPEPNKKFLVFVATIADKNQTKQQVVVARYGIRNASSEFIARRLLEIPATLYEYGFVVKHIGCDGATEICSALHYVGNVTANDIFNDVFTPDELRGLPMDFVVGCRHPSEGCEDVIILFGGDMPHWVKKFRNAFDNKSRELTYNGQIMKRAALKKIWELSESSGSNFWKTRFTYDYFELDSYKRCVCFWQQALLQTQ
jgi:hypothetical protein